MLNLTKHDMLKMREARYRLRMDLRVTSPEQARRFLKDVGFSFLFPIQGVDLDSCGERKKLCNAACALPRSIQPGK